jgi:hypothetical protein
VTFFWKTTVAYAVCVESKMARAAPSGDANASAIWRAATRR